MIDSADALTAFVARASNATEIALDTEFMREKTYRAELCLLQLAIGDEAVCIDPLALAASGADLSPLTPLLTSRRRQGHACRSPGSRGPAACRGTGPAGVRHADRRRAGRPPSQVGYAELTRRLIGVELPKAHTRADWSRRPLSAEQQEYALDDVKYLAALRTSLLDTLASKGRVAWLEEELAALANADALTRRPRRGLAKDQGSAGARSRAP